MASSPSGSKWEWLACDISNVMQHIAASHCISSRMEHVEVFHLVKALRWSHPSTYSWWHIYTDTSSIIEWVSDTKPHPLGM